MKFKPIKFKVIQKRREYHIYCGDTRIFIVTFKVILEKNYWTFKSCLSYIPSFKNESLKEGYLNSKKLIEEFIYRFVVYSKDKPFVSVNTKIDKMGGYWGKYKDNSIGRSMHYLYCICGLDIAERAVFSQNGNITYNREHFAKVNFEKGYPHFDFVKPLFNNIQNKLLLGMFS